MSEPPRRHDASRRRFLGLAGGLLSAAPWMRAWPVQVASASRQSSTTGMPSRALWYDSPADTSRLLFEGLPLGNGHMGALVGGNPAHDVMDLTVASLWTGHRNDTLQDDGQFPYDRHTFGSFTRMARLLLDMPGHGMHRIRGYRRELDLSTGIARITYHLHGVAYRRELFISHPDKVLVLRLSQSGGGHDSGRLRLAGMHGEATYADAGGTRLHLAGRFANGLEHAAALAITTAGGSVAAHGDALHFDHCEALTIVLAAATNYVPDLSRGFIDATCRPLDTARARVDAAAACSAQDLRQRHDADYQALFGTMQVDLGASLPAQRRLDTWTRLKARARSGIPDPELEALYLQYGRYLTIAGSRDGLPTNLQGLWLDSNEPPWNSDYHTDVNLQMNYWLPDRAGLGTCFDALADFCLAQLGAWTENTRRWFNDPRNVFRNTSGKLAGWTLAISVNIFGGNGWRWHPPGNAWLCNNLWHHYQYTLDRDYLARVFPLFKGACEFWQARLIEAQVVDPATGKHRRVLVDDHDWSPEQGPENARGITYAQELVWDLFGNFIEACRVLGRDTGHARTIAGLRERLYLPRLDPASGRLEEWMGRDDLGTPTHRHLSPLIGLFPGDRIHPRHSPKALVEGARRLLQARGMHSFGWANAWRALCWDRLGNGEKAYRLLANNLAPSSGDSNGTAANLLDVYHLPGQGVFQIDANYGMPAAMLDMLLYSHPGRIELLPALPRAWPSGRVTGIGARGGFVIDLAWADARPTHVVVHSIGGTRTTLAHGTASVPVVLGRGTSMQLSYADGRWHAH